MSNILIIKHGSLGDIVQISGVLKDIREHHISDKIYLMTTQKFSNLFNQCPYINEIIIDERKSKINIFYYLNLFNKLNKISFVKVYDLQNSLRTFYYQKFIKSSWSSTRNILKKGEIKSDFDQDGVLERFKIQLNRSGIKKCNYTLAPDFSWAINKDFKFNFKNYIFIAPFSSPKLKNKRWPYFKQLIEMLKKKYPDINLVTAPGNNEEIKLGKDLGLKLILNNNKPTNIQQLASVIKNSVFVISNDTGPAHIAAHLNCHGLVIFGGHTTPKKVSIERTNFRSLNKVNLNELKANDVYKEISLAINAILQK